MLIPIAIACNIVLACVIAWEAHQLLKVGVSVERRGWHRCHIHRLHDFVFRAEIRGRRSVRCKIVQDWPSTFDAAERASEFDLEPGEAVDVAFSATPRARGKTYLPATQVEIRFPSRWVALRRLQDVGQAIAVYPDLEQLTEYDALAGAHLLRRVGIHHQRQLGGGREFDQLRNYVPDDDYRQIDWKATARRHKPITMVYRTERSQSVLLCVDCGRLMGNPAGEGTYLDKATDACTLLAHVANDHGDQVGLLLFRDTVQKFLPPRHGRSAVLKIIDQLVDVAVERVFPSFAVWAEAIQVHHRKRSLVFLFTDLSDAQLSADLAQVVPVVSRKHVVVVISIRDPLLDQVADGAASRPEEIHRVLAARTLSDERAARKLQLTQAGVQVLDVEHPRLLVEAVNTYLDIKTRQLV